MNTVERVKRLCKERNVSIHKLEMDLEFSNGYISQLRKGNIPYDRLFKIANYFNVSIDYLMGNEEFTEEQALLDVRISKDPELKSALKKYFALSDTKKKHVLELIDLLSEGN